MGVLPLQNPTEMLNRFGALENYLNEYTSMNIKMKFYPTEGELGGFSAVVQDFIDGNIGFVFLAPVTTIQAYGNIGDDMEVLACGERYTGSPTYQGDLLVLESSPYQSIWDLEGKKVTGTSVSSTSGNLMPSAMLIKEEIDPDTFFDGGMQYLGSHDKAVEALLREVVDGAFVNEQTMEKFLENDAPIRSIWRHAPVPEFPISANKNVLSEEQIEEVRSALLSSVEVDPLIHERVDANYNRFVAVSIEDYLPLKEAIDAVHGEIFYDLETWGK
jgi:phosphonate transport system substrate-binding protein